MNTIRSCHHHGDDTWQNVSLSDHFSGRKAETKYRSASTEEQLGKSGVLPRATLPEPPPSWLMLSLSTYEYLFSVDPVSPGTQ